MQEIILVLVPWFKCVSQNHRFGFSILPHILSHSSGKGIIKNQKVHLCPTTGEDIPTIKLCCLTNDLRFPPDNQILSPLMPTFLRDCLCSLLKYIGRPEKACGKADIHMHRHKVLRLNWERLLKTQVFCKSRLSAQHHFDRFAAILKKSLSLNCHLIM